NPGEPDVRATPARGLDERLVRGRVLVHIRAQGGRPEAGQHERVHSVEGHRLNHTGHARNLTMSSLWESTRGLAAQAPSPGTRHRMASSMPQGGRDPPAEPATRRRISGGFRSWRGNSAAHKGHPRTSRRSHRREPNRLSGWPLADRLVFILTALSGLGET